MRNFFLVLLCALSASAQVQHLDIQVSDPNDRPVRGLKLTARTPSSTEVTDSAGKARLSYTSTSGVLDLLILAPANMVFISPWQASVQVPPSSWPIIVATKGQRDLLKRKSTVAALAARANASQMRTEIGEPPPTKLSREEAVGKTAEFIGLDREQLNSQIDALLKTSEDPYDRGQLALLDHRYQEASELFKSTLTGINPLKDPSTLEKATNASFFLGQSLFELAKFREAASAYENASKLRPNDPVILNNEGLSWSKAGDSDKAEKLFQRSIDIMKESHQEKTIDYSTTRNNLAAISVYKGDLDSAQTIFKDVLEQRQLVLGPNDRRIATSLNNVAAIDIAKGQCVAAEPLLWEALRINRVADGKATHSSQEQRFPSQPAMAAIPPTVSSPDQSAMATAPTVTADQSAMVAAPTTTDQSAMTAAPTVSANDTVSERHSAKESLTIRPMEQRSVAVAGTTITGNTPGTSSTLLNTGALLTCKQDYPGAVKALTLAKQIEESRPNRNDADLASIYLSLGKVAEVRNDKIAAATNYSAALNLFEAVYGDSHPSTATAMLALADIDKSNGKLAEAKALYKESLRIRLDRFGQNSPQVEEVKKRIISTGEEKP